MRASGYSRVMSVKIPWDGSCPKIIVDHLKHGSRSRSRSLESIPSSTQCSSIYHCYAFSFVQFSQHNYSCKKPMGNRSKCSKLEDYPLLDVFPGFLIQFVGIED